MIDRKFVTERYRNEKRLKSYVARVGGGLTPEEEILIEKYVPRKSSILVVGCGTGREMFGLKKLGFLDIVGVDISPDMIKEAKKLFPKIHFFISDINTFKTNKKFDAILYFNNVLEQIPSKKDREKAILKSKGLLKDSGVVILTTHSRFIPGKFGFGWFKSLFSYVLYLLGLGENPFEYINEKEKIYAYYSNPLAVLNFLKKNSFFVVEVNSKRYIIKGRKPRILWLFDEPVYYVVRT